MPEELYPDKPFAIIGAEDVVSGFQALGFRVYVVRPKIRPEQSWLRPWLRKRQFVWCRIVFINLPRKK